MTFYVNDPTDPIIETYEKVFPEMFTPLSAMPADLKAHLRVPEDLFDVETRMYARYHVTDPSAFYNNEDLWTVPPNPGGSQNLPNVAYYVEMRLPDETAPEFLLLQPMVPASRPNMIAWIAARNDQANYGQVRVYKFPQDTSVLGPNQIAAKIDADPTISAQVTLWDQAGSHVIKGNLIVVPVQNSLIYLQPVYLQSANSAFPAFERIIVATPTQVVWDTNLAGALNQLLCGGPERLAAAEQRAIAHAELRPCRQSQPGCRLQPAGRQRGRPRGLRQPALRAGPDGPAQRRLRDVRSGDRQGPGGPPRAEPAGPAASSNP